MFTCFKILGHIIFCNNATTLTNNIIIRLEGVWHDVVEVVVIYNIYITYIKVKSFSRFRSDFFLKKIYEVMHIENKKKFKGSMK
jgi:hypothetical protein